MTSNELTSLFFKELKQFNSTNFRTIAKADISKEDAVVHKACSSVVTRYFIFREKHPEISESDLRMLYFKLRIDMIARYFSEYPAASTEDLKPFQRELKLYLEREESERNAEKSKQASQATA